MSGAEEPSPGGAEELPVELVARAAAVLGVGEDGGKEGTRGHGQGAHLVAVRVAGPLGSRTMRVPLDVPVGELGGVLGEASGARGMASVRLRGRPVLPHQSLAEVGAGAGSTLVVDEAPGLVGEPSLVHSSLRSYAAPRPSSRGHGALLGALGAALAVGGFFAGGAALGGGKEVSAPPTAKLAREAAQAWLSGRHFAGPAGGDVGAGLGRRGGRLDGALEPAGWSFAPGLFAEQFMVGGPLGTYGLSVPIYHGYVVYPPTPSPLPFVEPPGAHVPETGTSARADLHRGAQLWASVTFTPAGALRLAGLSLAGKVQVLDEWRPRSGAALVARVQVPLSSADGFAVYQAKRRLGSAESAVLASRRSVVAGAERLKLAEARAKDAAAAGQPIGGLSAGSSLQQPVVTAQGEATEGAVTQAEEAFRAAERRLGSAERLAAASERELRQAKSRPTSVSGVYDVAFDRQGKALAWAPAGYGA